MIEFKEASNDKPYKIFRKLYSMAENKNQKNIEAMTISSYNSKTGFVDSRYVNLKYIIKNEWIFFTNYNSPKANQISLYPQVSVIFYWPEINTQIRIKANAFKTNKHFSDSHYKTRSPMKNILSSISDQSKEINSYSKFKNIFKDELKKQNESNFETRPEYWGGISFIPESFEFWEGQEFRINKRTKYKLVSDSWVKSILQP